MNSFLSNIRQHLSNPGGPCPFSTPAYHLWLQHPSNIRHEQLNAWFKEFNELHRIVKILLKLIRESTASRTEIAHKGFYQQTLDPKLDYHLIKIQLPKDQAIYPEISVGKHRLNIRFMELDTVVRSQQCKKDIPFELSCCLPFGSQQNQHLSRSDVQQSSTE